MSKDLEVHLNGNYEIWVTAGDYRAESTIRWELGQIKIWYKEGHDEGSNNGIKADYLPLPTIEFTAPAAAPQISVILPLIGSAVLVFLFLRFVVSGLMANRANLSRVNFWGLLFILNLLLILVIFTAFFIEVKLIPILWLLLFLSPISFFIA